MDPSCISDLARLFRDRGEEVLNGDIKFSLTGQMLRALNDSFSLIVNSRDCTTPPGEHSPKFIVCPTITESRSEVFLDLQLIYDFVQILVHVHISHLVTDDDLEASVDLVNFRNLQKLEILKLPVRKLLGLRRLRSQLHELSCQQCLAKCQDVLLHCGADRSGELIWTRLHSINFSYNGLEQIDDSVRWTPWVHTLNLSHNRLTAASLLPLKFLANLKSLDLSYNRLSTIPELSVDASRKLQTLRVCGNSIDDIQEVSNLEALVEFDVSNNCLLFDLALIPISALATLRVLNYSGNPLAFHPRHRPIVISYLHSNTSTVKFVLNGAPMTRTEKKWTGAHPSYHNLRRQSKENTSAGSSSLTNSVTTIESTGENVRSDKATDSAKKRSKRREIMLTDDPIETVVAESPRISLSTRRKFLITAQDDHLETKKQIERLREQFGSNWLNADGENIVKEVFPRSEREEGEYVRRRQILDDDSILSSTPKDNFLASRRMDFSDNNLSATTTENYRTASEQTITSENGEGKGTTDGTTTAAYESAFSKDPDLTGLDFFQSQQSVEEEVTEPNEVEYKVQKLNTVKDESGWKVQVVVSDLSIKEKDAERNETLTRWGLTVLESCERPSRNVLSIHFNTMRSDKRQRHYLFAEEKDCLKLTEYLRNILEKRDWDEFNHLVYRCANCTTQFCVDRQNQKATERVKCPECQSSYVIEITEQTTNKLKNPSVQKVLSQEEDKAEVIVKSTSHSSIGSADSLKESSSCSKISNPPASIDSNESVAGSSTSERDKDKDLNSRRLGMDSDVEILSNPSQSSIEVLNYCSKNSSRKHSEERRNFLYNASGQLVDGASMSVSNQEDEKDAMEPALEASSVSVAHKLMGSIQLQTLTESSSSGSITESVCTQYEQPQPVPAVVVAVEEAVEVSLESDQNDVGFKKSSSAFFEGFLNASNMLKNLGNTTSIKAADGIRLVKVEPFLFSTLNFQQTDHRLHLYLHQNVFLESNEKFGSVVQVRFIEDARQGESRAILVLSNRMIYLFLVTGDEHDDPGQWLRLIHRRDLKEWTGVQVLPSDIGLRMSFSGNNNNSWNLLMEDGQHTRNYLQAIAELERPCSEDMCPDHRRKLRDAVGGEDPLIVAPLRGIVKTVNERAQLVDQKVALLVTNKTFAVLLANWQWLIEGVSDVPEVLFQLALEDMVECEVESETAFVLNFMDEQEKKHELWRLEFDTKFTADSVLEAIKGPWEKVFGVSLVTR